MAEARKLKVEKAKLKQAQLVAELEQRAYSPPAASISTQTEVSYPLHHVQLLQISHEQFIQRVQQATRHAAVGPCEFDVEAAIEYIFHDTGNGDTTDHSEPTIVISGAGLDQIKESEAESSNPVFDDTSYLDDVNLTTLNDQFLQRVQDNLNTLGAYASFRSSAAQHILLAHLFEAWKQWKPTTGCGSCGSSGIDVTECQHCVLKTLGSNEKDKRTIQVMTAMVKKQVCCRVGVSLLVNIQHKLRCTFCDSDMPSLAPGCKVCFSFWCIACLRSRRS